MGREGRLGEHIPRLGGSRRPAVGRADRLLRGQGASLCHRRPRGELSQAIGRSRGGRTTKIHALTDRLCRPVAFMLTGGQVADRVAADELLDQLVSADVLHGDKGYDSDAVRRKIESKGAAPNIPPKVNRRWKTCFSPYLDRQRNAIERMFGRLKDFRRIATRYDRLARNFLVAVCLAATICYWLRVRTLDRNSQCRRLALNRYLLSLYQVPVTERMQAARRSLDAIVSVRPTM
jgi:transposase